MIYFPELLLMEFCMESTTSIQSACLLVKQHGRLPRWITQLSELAVQRSLLGNNILWLYSNSVLRTFKVYVETCKFEKHCPHCILFFCLQVSDTNAPQNKNVAQKYEAR